MNSFEYTLVRTVENSPVDHLVAAADDLDLEDEIELLVEIFYRVEGRYRRPTYHHPGESPEIEIVRVVYLDEHEDEHELELTAEEEYEVIEQAYQDLEMTELLS